MVSREGSRRRIIEPTRAVGFIVQLLARLQEIRMMNRRSRPEQDVLYNPRKAAQVVAYFALRQGGRAIEVLKAVKLAYLADRESLRRWGEPILHEPRLALKLGPVNQTTMEYINGERIDDAGWGRFVSARPAGGNAVEVAQGVLPSDLDEFSDDELEILDEIWKRHGSYTGFQIAHWTHLPGVIPEWRDPAGGRLTIELHDVLRAVGFPDPEAAMERIEGQRSTELSFRKLR